MTETISYEEDRKKRQDEYSLFMHANPLNTEDRIRAAREEFTSTARDCPFYSETVRSKCLVEPSVIFLPECSGRSFYGGICCPKIILSSHNDRRAVEK